MARAWHAKAAANDNPLVLQKDVHGCTALFAAVRFATLPIVARLLAARSDVNATMSDSTTALMHATLTADVGVVNELL
eukprot:2636252-Prymnesium_polylepis.1